MRFFKRAAAAALLTAAFTGGAAGNAQAADGCVGFPGMGGLAYHCLAVNPILPSVSLAGSTPVGATVPAFCYFVGCTENTPVGTSIPFSISTSRPNNHISVFELRFSCSEGYYGTSCQNMYRLHYHAGESWCYFETDDPSLTAIRDTMVPCTV